MHVIQAFCEFWKVPQVNWPVVIANHPNATVAERSVIMPELHIKLELSPCRFTIGNCVLIVRSVGITKKSLRQ